ncbi:MAG: FMN-binding protein [bacterium]
MAVEPISVATIPDGTYTGFATLGFPYEIEVTVKNDRLTSVRALNNRKTFYANLAELTLQKMVRDNRVDVDAVSGATTTGTALRKAVENALRKALLQPEGN